MENANVLQYMAVEILTGRASVKTAANGASSQIHKDPEPRRVSRIAPDPRLLHYFDLETGVAIPTVDVPVVAPVVS